MIHRFYSDGNHDGYRWTEKGDSQKGIIIGKRGALLKEIGSEARTDIEMLLGTKVYLNLWVKVQKDWRNKAGQLRELGFRDDEY